MSNLGKKWWKASIVITGFLAKRLTVSMFKHEYWSRRPCSGRWKWVLKGKRWNWGYKTGWQLCHVSEGTDFVSCPDGSSWDTRNLAHLSTTSLSFTSKKCRSYCFELIWREEPELESLFLIWKMAEPSDPLITCLYITLVQTARILRNRPAMRSQVTKKKILSILASLASSIWISFTSDFLSLMTNSCNAHTMVAGTTAT